MTFRRRVPPLLLLLAVAGCASQSPVGPGLTVPFSTADLRVGTGAEAVAGRIVSVNYELWLYSATNPDNKGTFVEGGPWNFVLGAREVIAGWDQGVPGMRVGGLRRIVVPPDLAYGPSGLGPIPPNATLIFEVELLDVQ